MIQFPEVVFYSHFCLEVSFNLSHQPQMPSSGGQAKGNLCCQLQLSQFQNKKHICEKEKFLTIKKYLINGQGGLQVSYGKEFAMIWNVTRPNFQKLKQPNKANILFLKKLLS